VWASHLNAWRITLTPSALLDADVILMIVAGAKKAGAVRHARDAPLDLARFPAQLLREAGERVGWMIDRAASSDG
jgi:6-phosphogluconolactonase/glucosamine-6-phosphate isomerase/deaminase